MTDCHYCNKKVDHFKKRYCDNKCEIAKIYSVDNSLISHIKRGRLWSHV